ncbi:MAG: hypothetical protein K2X62_11885 [Beijerinckiaceae bacterium]|jgi:tripartite-type tricarboxylate transporter receptor subunit TctC|nr:hypothetical protein [Beijerinckiaceae bacterium]MDO9442384.1 tripartite tricarboxylate transporter substrate-binding protein [Beijerinckiaceae bacterium]
MRSLTRGERLLFAAALVSISGGVARSDDVEAFYAGKTLQMFVGYPPGGSNDLYARTVAAHLGKFLPGKPNIIVQNMPGAGSLVAANFMFSAAAKDGTAIGVVSQGMPLQAKLGQAQVRFDPSKFNWIGRTTPSGNVTMVWHTSKAKSIADAYNTQITLSGTGAGSTVSLYPSVMNEVLNTRFKLIMGYKGSADAMLAMERGETEGHSTSWEAVQAVHPDWLKDGKIRILVQHSIKRLPALADVPTSVELAKTPQDKAVMRTIMSAAEVGKAYFTSPGVPPERVAALRRAFDKMVKDPAFIKDQEKLGGDVDPLSGEELQELIGELDTIPADVIERVKAVYKE